METGSSTDFFAGANQPAGAPVLYLWTPLIILAAGVVILIVALIHLARADRRARELPPSFFDQ
ncbi:MAG TPA: hypothetical protein VHC68_03150 [Candidatus Paceibacterota bacterium]|nr:hypothetical protein [Candidatus Paceibacterota bacterium]